MPCSGIHLVFGVSRKISMELEFEGNIYVTLFETTLTYYITGKPKIYVPGTFYRRITYRLGK